MERSGKPPGVDKAMGNHFPSTPELASRAPELPPSPLPSAGQASAHQGGPGAAEGVALPIAPTQDASSPCGPSSSSTPPASRTSASLVTFTQAGKIELRPTDWLLRGWLVRDTLAAIVAPSGAGKTFLAIDWACHVATGKPWGGRHVHQGAVYYLAGEGMNGLRKRTAAWEAHHKHPLGNAPLMLADGLPTLADLSNTEAIIQSIHESADELFYRTGSEPTLIVIDTLARAMAGADENSSRDMGALIGGLDRIRQQWGCTVLVLHHTGHAASDRARGSSAFHAALDSEFMITPGKKSFTIRATKCKDWEAPTPLTLQWAEVEITVPNDDPDGPKLIGETSRAITLLGRSQVQRSRLEEARYLSDELGMSQRDIASELAISKTTVQRLLLKSQPCPDDAG